MKKKAKQNKGRNCRLNATVTPEEKAALDRLAIAGGFRSTSAMIGALGVHLEKIGLGFIADESFLGPYFKSKDEAAS